MALNMKNKYAFALCIVTWIISLTLSALIVFLANGAYTSYQSIEACDNRDNHTAEVVYSEVEIHAFYKETKFLKRKTELLESILRTKYANESWFQEEFKLYGCVGWFDEHWGDFLKKTRTDTVLRSRESWSI